MNTSARVLLVSGVSLAAAITVCAFPAQTTLYNVQLNGQATAYVGAAQTGSAGDVWNNISLGATAVSLLTSSGGASSVTLGSFSAVNHLAASAYTSTGSPVAGLNDNALKLDWNGSTWGNWPTATLTLSGLPANAPVTVFGYGASFYNTYTLGSTWTLGAGNGGATASMGYYGPAVSADPAGMDLTLVENQGVSWIVIAGNADASGNLTVVMTPTSVAAPSGGSQAYWQTYLNGMQVEVAAVPEPGTLALVTLGFGGFLILRRR